MFERFIVATDLSPACCAVVRCLKGLRTFGARQCLLLQCLSMQEAGSAAYSYSTEHLEGPLAEQKSILEDQGFEVEARVVPGFAKHEVNRLAKAEDFDLIVVGTQGYSLVGGAILGGVAYSIIHGARTPVLLVPITKKPGDKHECEPVARCNFNAHILFPTDFSENADHAFGVVRHSLAREARRVTLFHVQDKSRIAPHLSERLQEFNRIDRERLESMSEAIHEQSKAEVDIEIVYGTPFAEITRVIRERDIQLVVMGSQGRGFVSEVFLGSVSHNVARHSEAPVLLIPAKGR